MTEKEILTDDEFLKGLSEFAPAKPSGPTDGTAGTRPAAQPIGQRGSMFPGSGLYVTAKRIAGYELLEQILDKAYEQSAKGKGHERHAHSPVGFRAWIDQPILANARQVGPAGPGQQVMKKTQEAVMMAARGDFEAAKAEVLGSIVYAAALYQLLSEMEKVK